jgi:integrase
VTPAPWRTSPRLAGTLRGARGVSSAGRAPALQAGGRRFDPGTLHSERAWKWALFACSTRRSSRCHCSARQGARQSHRFEPRAVARRAERAWAAYSVGAFIPGEPSVFEPFTLHEARHSFSTWMDHAGISEARCDRYMGHARSGVAGRYRHLLPAQIAEDAAKLDAYLTGARGGKVRPLAAGQ